MQAFGRQPCAEQRAPAVASVHYERHRPEQTTLYRLVQEHAASFIAHTEDSIGSELPQFIKAKPGHKQSGGLFVPGEGPGLPGVWASAACKAEPVQGRPHRIGWARLLERVCDIDMQHCPNCGGGELEIIAAILERPVIEKILTHLGLRPDVRVRKDSHACRRPGRDFTQPGWILNRRPRPRRASRGGLELAEPHPPSHQDDAASGRKGGLGERAWAVPSVACVRRLGHQGEP